MSIRIVTHCYAKELPQYAVFLRAQLSSLIRYPCQNVNVPVRISVCYSPSDRHTTEVLWKQCKSRWIDVVPLDEPRLWRRAIGRNIVAKECKEDIVWFTDVDHYFGAGCLDALWSLKHMVNNRASMIFPETIWIHKSHSIGDNFWRANANAQEEIHPDLKQFIPKRYHRAIGGVQIVSGEVARLGYLDGHRKYQRPHDAPFKNFRDDIAYRKQCLKLGPIVPITLPNLFRLRHLRTTYKGHAG